MNKEKNNLFPNDLLIYGKLGRGSEAYVHEKKCPACGGTVTISTDCVISNFLTLFFKMSCDGCGYCTSRIVCENEKSPIHIECFYGAELVKFSKEYLKKYKNEVGMKGIFSRMVTNCQGKEDNKKQSNVKVSAISTSNK